MQTINTNNISLELACRLTDMANAAWQSGEMLQKVTPTTAALLHYWFDEGFCQQRVRNFHEGQRQAILNIIYLHEVLGETTVHDAYEKVIPELMDRANLAQLAKPKYQFPKYAVKMATGTGKTWVMHALLIWQMLNARHEEVESGRFTQKFLIVAPGLIVYDRLLDAFCGRKRRDEEYRDPQTNDYYMNQDVFIPERYRDEVFSFIQNNVVTKEDGIGRKTTGDGLIALTNWHLFENQMEETESDGEWNDSSTVTPSVIVSELLPVRPGKSAGNDLSMLDRRALGGTELEYLTSLKDLMVINDEAHHIHEIKRNGETGEVEWQRGLNAISGTKGKRFVQVDFSATPFDTKGTGEKQVKLFFPHIVVDFDLPTAMRLGLVKLLLLDRRPGTHRSGGPRLQCRTRRTRQCGRSERRPAHDAPCRSDEAEAAGGGVCADRCLKESQDAHRVPRHHGIALRRNVSEVGRSGRRGHRDHRLQQAGRGKG